MFALVRNGLFGRTDLLGGAAKVLRERLPPTWSVDIAPAASGDELRALDETIVLTQPNGAGVAFAVEARPVFAPRDVPALLSGLARSMRALASGVPLLLVAPWIGRRGRALLAAEGINYVDLTGNVRVQLDDPTLFLSSQGAERDPFGQPRGRARVRGPKAGRLIRTLVDAQPPYGVRELAEATDLAPGYVSQLLQTLDREALITRSPRGGVEAVEVGALLRRWAESYDVLRSNTARTFVSRGGVDAAFLALAGIPADTRVALTGSFAAVGVAPVAVPALLLAYCEDVEAVARELRLLPADTGADVALLDPFDPVVWAGLDERADGLREVSPAQVVVDCLTGTGRMPAEGEAVLDRLIADEGWRRPLDELTFPWSDGA